MTVRGSAAPARSASEALAGASGWYAAELRRLLLVHEFHGYRRWNHAGPVAFFEKPVNGLAAAGTGVVLGLAGGSSQTEELEKARVEAIAHIGRERRRRRAVQRRTLVAIALAVILLLAFLPSAQVTVAGEQSSVGPIELDVAATTAGSVAATSYVTRLSAFADGMSPVGRENTKPSSTAVHGRRGLLFKTCMTTLATNQFCAR